MNIYNSYNINIYGNLGSLRYTSGINEENRSNLLEKILLNLFNILEKNKFEFLEDFGIIEDNGTGVTYPNTYEDEPSNLADEFGKWYLAPLIEADLDNGYPECGQETAAMPV